MKMKYDAAMMHTSRNAVLQKQDLEQNSSPSFSEKWRIQKMSGWRIEDGEKCTSGKNGFAGDFIHYVSN